MKYHRNSFALCCWLLKSIVIFILFYLPHPRYEKVPGPEMELAPQQWSETQQWNCWILNQMSHGNFTFFFPQILHIKLLAGKCADIKANKKKIWCKAKEQEKKRNKNFHSSWEISSDFYTEYLHWIFLKLQWINIFFCSIDSPMGSCNSKN